MTEEDGRGFWYASDLKAPALWDAVHSAGLTVGAVSWPSSAGSESIEWNLPEFWSSLYGHELSMMRRYAKKEVLKMAEHSAPPLAMDALMDEARIITVEDGRMKRWSAMVLNSGGSAGVHKPEIAHRNVQRRSRTFGEEYQRYRRQVSLHPYREG